MGEQSDYQYMARALQLARRGVFTVSPNPMVGCVVVNSNKVIGEGWHQKAGSGHAEVNALVDLTIEQTKGATVYVTLEPCSHFGRTPPCANLLVDKQVSKVVVAMLDPNPLVAGNGIKLLQQAGIEVEVGVLEQQAKKLNKAFNSRMTNGRPYVQLKQATSLDGKVALGNFDSKWITGPSARSDVQKYRAQACSILTSASTVITDNAKMNVRTEQLFSEYPQGVEVRQPSVIILDGSNRITKDSYQNLAVFHTQRNVILVKGNQQDCFVSDNLLCITLSYDANSGFDLTEVLDWLGHNEVNLLWVEAGAKLSAAFMQHKLVNEYILYIASKILGSNAIDSLPIGPYESIAEVLTLPAPTITSVGDDIKLCYQMSE